jgi:hypothetical protein
MCGGTDVIKQDGVFVCQSCGVKYSLEEAKKMMVEVTGGTVEVSNQTSFEKQLILLREEIEEWINEVETNGQMINDYTLHQEQFEQFLNMRRRLYKMREMEPENIYTAFYRIFLNPLSGEDYTAPCILGDFKFIYGYPEPMCVIIYDEEEYNTEYRKATYAEWINNVSGDSFFTNIEIFLGRCSDNNVSDFIDAFVQLFFICVAKNVGVLDDGGSHNKNGSIQAWLNSGHDIEKSFMNPSPSGKHFAIFSVKDNINEYLLPYLQERISSPYSPLLIDAIKKKISVLPTLEQLQLQFKQTAIEEKNKVQNGICPKCGNRLGAREEIFKNMRPGLFFRIGVRIRTGKQIPAHFYVKRCKSCGSQWNI